MMITAFYLSLIRTMITRKKPLSFRYLYCTVLLYD